MKEKVKIWSRRRLLGAFLAFLGLSAVATAQNGAVTANCGSELAIVTRTVDQLKATEGTVIPLTFTTQFAAGDELYFVAAAGGSLTSITAGCGLSTGIGLGVTVLSPLPDTDPNNGIEGAHQFTGNASEQVNVTVKVADAVAGSSYFLGVYVKNITTGCYSDVYWVEIQVITNIYASLTLNDANPYEYICNGGTTNTNIGFTLCNLPATGTLSYTVNVANNGVAAATISGANVYGADDNGHDGEGNGSFTDETFSGSNVDLSSNVANASISGIVPTASLLVGELTYTKAYTVKIGTQTLTNASDAVAGTAVYTFTDMTYSYTDNGRNVVVPVVFESSNGSCHTAENYYNAFTVHVAPAFTITPLQYADDARTREVTTGFCQGTIAYLKTTTSATEGKITDWVWTVDATSNNAPEAKAKFFPAFTDDQAAITGGTTLVEGTAKVGELTKIEEGVYKYDLVATWNDADNHYTGCTANADIDIVVNAAPILLLATDQADVDGIPTWNATNKITAPVVCPGNPVLMATNETEDFAADDAAARTQYMNDGNYIRANGATLKYTITLDPADATAAAYTYWRANTVTNGTLPLTQTDADGNALNPVQYGHFLNNDGTAQANIIYTVENNDPNGCKLVKSDGSSLNLEAEKDGKVQIIFPVQPRPQFQLGAN